MKRKTADSRKKAAKKRKTSSRKNTAEKRDQILHRQEQRRETRCRVKKNKKGRGDDSREDEKDSRRERNDNREDRRDSRDTEQRQQSGKKIAEWRGEVGGEKKASRKGREESKGPGQAPERGEYQFGPAVSLCCGVVCFCCVLRWCGV